VNFTLYSPIKDFVKFNYSLKFLEGVPFLGVSEGVSYKNSYLQILTPKDG